MFRINFAIVPARTTLELERVYTTNELALPSFDSDEESADESEDHESEGADKNAGDGTAPATEKPGTEADTVGSGQVGDGQAVVLSVRKTADEGDNGATTNEEPGADEAAAAVEGPGADQAATEEPKSRLRSGNANGK